MNSGSTAYLSLILLIAGASGCGTASSENAASKVRVDGAQFMLMQEPDGAVGVIDARESAEDGAPLVLVGRIGGTANPWIDGRSAFTLLDASVAVVDEDQEPDEGEICTGDCCDSERLECTTLVKVVDESGQIIPIDSRELLGLKESDMIVAQGTAKKDQSGNFTMLAKHIYIRN